MQALGPLWSPAGTLSPCVKFQQSRDSLMYFPCWHSHWFFGQRGSPNLPILTLPRGAGYALLPMVFCWFHLVTWIKHLGLAEWRWQWDRRLVDLGGGQCLAVHLTAGVGHGSQTPGSRKGGVLNMVSDSFLPWSCVKCTLRWGFLDLKC